MLDPLPLRTERLWLRYWREADASDLVGAWLDDSIGGSQAHADISIEAARAWIGGAEERRRRDRALDLVISPMDSTAVWGEVGLVPSRHRRGGAEVGYWTAHEVRGQGVATEALTLLTSWALGEGGFSMLAARCSPDNTGSIAVARRAGYERVAATGGHITLIALASSRAPGDPRE